MLETGTRADAENWIGSDKHTLGELSPAKGRSLVDKLMRAGAKRLYACKIDQYENSEENTGHLVIELPEAPGDRKKVLAEVDRLASRQGFRGEPDHGQQYAYVKLD
jgi:hypothetical protein